MIIVLSTTGRGPHTLYTCTDGVNTFQVKRADLPEETFKQWRLDQASRCMRIKREKDESSGKELKPLPKLEMTTCVDASVQTEDALIEKDAEKRELVETDEQQASGRPTTSRAQNLLLCKICSDKEVAVMVIPCCHLVFCKKCLMTELTQRSTCPICRTTINDHFEVVMIE